MSVRRIIPAILSSAIIVLMGLAPDYARAQSSDLAAGKKLYQRCAECHGEQAQGVINKGARLNGQHTWYLRSQIRKFDIGHRGYSDDDAYGAMMRKLTQSLKDEQTIKNVLTYIATMKPVVVESTIKGGDSENGKVIWDNTCAFCHGEDGMGRHDLGTPRLAGQADWYLVRQLKSFNAELRGAHKYDENGQMMRSMTLDGPDALDVASYLSRLP